MPSIETLVESASLLIAHFGEWPSFHDAEIVDLHCWRGRVKPGDWDDNNIFPILTMKILILRATQKKYERDKPDIVATFRFHDVDNLHMDGFNHINMILDFAIATEDRGTYTSGKKLLPYLVISITRGFGMEAFFKCFRIEVLEAVPVQQQDLRI